MCTFMTVREAQELHPEDKNRLIRFLEDVPLGDYYTVRSGDEETWDGKPSLSCINSMTYDEAMNYRRSGGAWTYCEKVAETSINNF